MMVLLEERKGKENERMATAKREAWADAVDPWRQFFSSKIPFRFRQASGNPPNAHPGKSPTPQRRKEKKYTKKKVPTL